ncbi:unnamed protein product, partial [Ectocarpus sp. 12 AP-2014]
GGVVSGRSKSTDYSLWSRSFSAKVRELVPCVDEHGKGVCRRTKEVVAVVSANLGFIRPYKLLYQLENPAVGSASNICLGTSRHLDATQRTMCRCALPDVSVSIVPCSNNDLQHQSTGKGVCASQSGSWVLARQRRKR